MFQPLCLLHLSLLLSFGAVTQSTTPQTGKPAPTSAAKPPARAETTEAQARAQRGFELLCDAGFEAAKLADREMAARLLSKIAELIWKRAPEQAADFTRKAFEQALEHLQDNQPRITAIAPHRDFYQRYLLCRSVLNLANRQDAKLGQNLEEKFNGPWAQMKEEKRRLGYLVSLNDSYILDSLGVEGPQFPSEFGPGHIGFALGGQVPASPQA